MSRGYVLVTDISTSGFYGTGSGGGDDEEDPNWRDVWAQYFHPIPIVEQIYSLLQNG